MSMASHRIEAFGPTTLSVALAVLCASLQGCAPRRQDTVGPPPQTLDSDEHPSPEEEAAFDRSIHRYFEASDRADFRFVAALMHLWHRALHIEYHGDDRLVVAEFDCDPDSAQPGPEGPVGGNPYCFFVVTYNPRTSNMAGGPPLVTLECGDAQASDIATTTECWDPSGTWLAEHDPDIRQALAQSRRVSDRIVAALYHRWSRTVAGVCANGRELARVTFTCEGGARLDPERHLESLGRCVFDIVYDPTHHRFTGGPESEALECVDA